MFKSFLSVILISGTSLANDVSCVSSLESQSLKVKGGLNIQRVAPVEQNLIAKPEFKPALLPPPPIVKFEDRVRLARTLQESGFFMSQEFESMLKSSLGSYAKMIQKSEQFDWPEPL